MIELLLSILVGVVIGYFIGIIPGLHPNSIFSIILPFIYLIFSMIGFINTISLLISLTITYTFTSFFSALLLNIPDEETSLGVVRIFKIISQGKLYEILLYTLVGGYFSIFLVIIFAFLFSKLIKSVYQTSISLLPVFLLLFTLYIISSTKNKKNTITIILLSSVFGYLVLNLYVKFWIKLSLMFSGAFGVSSIIYFLLTQKEPKKTNLELEIKTLNINTKSIILGTLGSLLISIFPSLSPSQSLYILSKFRELDKDENYYTALGALTTSDTLVSLLFLYIIGNPRSGLAVFLDKILFHIEPYEILYFLIISIISASLVVLFFPTITKYLLKLIYKVDQRKLSVSLVILIFSLFYKFSGFLGIFILIMSTLLGIICHFLNVEKIHLTYMLIGPTILSFIL